MPECYVRGATIKYMKVPEEVIQMVKEEETDLKQSLRMAKYGASRRGRGRGGTTGQRSRYQNNKTQQTQQTQESKQTQNNQSSNK